MGDKVHLLCQYSGPIEGCSFVIPGEDAEIDLQPNQQQITENFKYFGKGFDRGECGVTIENVTARNEGFATCILALNSTFELYEAIEVKIIDHKEIEASLPKMKILNVSPLKVGQQLAAECSAKSYNEVNFLWLLNGRILNGTSVPMVKKKYERDKGIVFEFKSILKYDSLDIRDNGSILRCRIQNTNSSSEFIDTSLSLVVLNETKISTASVGEPFDISIKFFAFPRVLSSRWKVNKRTIYYGKATSEFSSKELKYLGNNQWNAVLHIANVTDENIHFNYTLQISDSEGTKFYHHRLDSFNSSETSDDDDESSTNNNFVTTTLPKYAKTEKQHHKASSSSLSNRRTTTTTRNFSNTNENTAQPTIAAVVERKIKFIRKQQQQQRQPSQNTSTTMTEMTSVIASTTTTEQVSTTQASSTFISTHTNKTDSSVENNINDNTTTAASSNDDAKLTNYFDITTYEVINTTESSDGSAGSQSAKIQNIFVAASFLMLIFVIIIISILLCHYRHQVSILKTEIIQMNLESYYNQSCLYPSNFNEYSGESIQRSGVAALICDNKRSLSECSEESSNIVQTYSTNSHLYQSIDECHVYDEIINSMEQESESQRVCDDEKLNNYENNESFNSKSIFLKPTWAFLVKKK